MKFNDILAVLNNIKETDDNTQFYIQTNDYDYGDICVLGVYIDKEYKQNNNFDEILVASDIESYITNLLDSDCNVTIKPILISDEQRSVLKTFSTIEIIGE